MFYTLPDAEQPMPECFAPMGERKWRWVELGLQIPYFLLHVVFTRDDEMTREKHFVFSLLRDALDLIAVQSSQLQVKELSLISPDYMNGTSGYRLDTIKQIWRDKETGKAFSFVLSDGRKLAYDLDGDEEQDREMELLLAL